MSDTAKAMQQSFALRFSSGAFLAFWCLLAAFPIFWIAVMSFKSPVDAFADSPWDVILGPATRASGDGLSVIDIILGLVVLFFAIRWAFTKLPGLVQQYCPPGLIVLGWLVGALGAGLFGLCTGAAVIPLVSLVIAPLASRWSD